MAGRKQPFTDQQVALWRQYFINKYATVDQMTSLIRQEVPDASREAVRKMLGGATYRDCSGLAPEGEANDQHARFWTAERREYAAGLYDAGLSFGSVGERITRELDLARPLTASMVRNVLEGYW